MGRRAALRSGDYRSALQLLRSGCRARNDGDRRDGAARSGRIAEDNGRRAELPPEVADWMVRPYAVPGGMLLDPFAGSFEIVRAAERAGMHGVGIEQSALAVVTGADKSSLENGK